MRRFEMELAGAAPVQPPPPGHAVAPPGTFQPTLQHGPTIAQQPMPMRFIPHQLMHRGPVARPQPYVVHAAPQPAQHSFNPFMSMMPPMFPRMPSLQASQAPTSSQRSNVQQNTLQVSANKAMLDAQKAMAMQVINQKSFECIRLRYLFLILNLIFMNLAAQLGNKNDEN